MKKSDSIHDLLDNIVERINAEMDTTGRQIAYLVWVVDTSLGKGDMRLYGEMDGLLAMCLRAQKAIFDNLNDEEPRI